MRRSPKILEKFEFDITTRDEFLRNLNRHKASSELNHALESFIFPNCREGDDTCSHLVLSVKFNHSDTVVAFSYFSIEGNTACIWGLYVDGNFRRLGLGSRCLRFSVGSIVGRRLKRIFVGFIDPGAAQGQLYKRFCDEVLPMYRPSVKFCIVAKGVPLDKSIWDWIPVP